MSADKFGLGIERLSKGIQVCMDTRVAEPALMLLYASIDIAAWLNNDDPKAKVKESFTGWVESYLFKAKKLDCDAIDLYAARCGFLHRFTPDSHLTEQGSARRLSYAWGSGEAAWLRLKLAAPIKAGKLAVVQIEDLQEGWFKGVALLNEELQKDPSRATRVYQRAGQFFFTISVDKDGRMTPDT